MLCVWRAGVSAHGERFRLIYLLHKTDPWAVVSFCASTLRETLVSPLTHNRPVHDSEPSGGTLLDMIRSRSAFVYSRADVDPPASLTAVTNSVVCVCCSVISRVFPHSTPFTSYHRVIDGIS